MFRCHMMGGGSRATTKKEKENHDSSRMSCVTNCAAAASDTGRTCVASERLRRKKRRSSTKAPWRLSLSQLCLAARFAACHPNGLHPGKQDTYIPPRRIDRSGTSFSPRRTPPTPAVVLRGGVEARGVNGEESPFTGVAPNRVKPPFRQTCQSQTGAAPNRPDPFRFHPGPVKPLRF